LSRISPETLTVGLLAVILSTAGAFTVRYYLTEDVPVPPAPPSAIIVPLASNELPAGKRLALGDIAIMPMTPAEIRDRELPMERTMLNPEQIIGRVLKESITPGEPFVTTNLYPVGTGPNLAERLKPGLRAVTVDVAGSAAVDGMASPGSVVDVLFRSTARGSSRGSAAIPEATMTLMEGVEVLALDNITTPGVVPSGKIKSITLAVSPEEATVLRAVEGRGALSLSLRAPGETVAQYHPERVTLEKLLGVRPAPAAFMVEVYRAGARQTIVFERDQVAEESFGGLSNLLSGPVSRGGASSVRGVTRHADSNRGS